MPSMHAGPQRGGDSGCQAEYIPLSFVGIG